MSYKILVIDHDPAGAERIQRPLAEAGYDVVVRSEAAEAMSAFQEVRPDLAVIEALLPEKPGPVLCQQIKDSPAGKTTPVVLLLEADEEKQAQARALDLHGCDLLIERSIPETELVELLEELLRTRLAQAEREDQTGGEPEDSDSKAAAKPEQESKVGGATEGPGKLIDSNGVVDALSKLDAIIEERAASGDGAKARGDVEGADPPRDEEKVKRAERAGDFSFLREETEEKPVVQEKATRAAEEETTSTRSADIGQDIVDHIDALFATSEPGGPTLAEKQVLSWTFESNVDGKTDGPSPAPAEQPTDTAPPSGPPERPTEESPVAAAGAPAAADRPARPAEPPKSAEPAKATRTSVAADPKAAETMQTASFAQAAPRPARESLPPAEGRHRWLVVAACLAVVLIGGGLAILFLGGEAESPDASALPAIERSPVAATVGAPVPSPVEESASTPVGIEAEPSEGPIESPRQPVPEEIASGGRPAEPAAAAAPPEQARDRQTASSRPEPRVDRAERPLRETAEAGAATGSPVTASRDVAAESGSEPVESAPTASQPDPPAPIAEERVTQPAAEPEAETAAAESPEVAAPRGQSASPPDEVPVASAPPPVPAEPVLEPPQLLERTEPDYPAKSLKRARGERIRLRLLISDRGRISRVLVEEGTQFKDLEAAAVSAVLRWKYRPASEDGTAVEAWTTAEFTF